MTWTAKNVDRYLAHKHAVKYARYYKRTGKPGIAQWMLFCAAELRREIAGQPSLWGK